MTLALAEHVSRGHLLEQSASMSETIGHVDSWLQDAAGSLTQT